MVAKRRRELGTGNRPRIGADEHLGDRALTAYRFRSREGARELLEDRAVRDLLQRESLERASLGARIVDASHLPRDGAQFHRIERPVTEVGSRDADLAGLAARERFQDACAGAGI